MSRRTAWRRVRGGFAIVVEGELIRGEALVEMPAEHAAGLAHCTEPARPWLPRRIAWRIGRRLRLARKAISEARKQRRRLRAWRRRRLARMGR